MPWIIGGAAVIGGALSYAGQKDANQTNQNLSKSNREWQEYMSNTSYQRAVGDLKKAGLNPMLAYMKGGASTPSGNVATVQNEMGGFNESVNSAASAYRTSIEARNLRELNNKIKADTDAAAASAENQRAQAAVNAAMVPKLQADTVAATNSASYTAAQTRVADVTLEKVLAETRNIRDENERIRAGTAKILEETKNVPLTGDQIRHMIDLLVVQAKGGDLQNVQRILQTPKMQNEANAEQSWWKRNVSPFLPDFSTITQGANSARGATR